MSLQRRRPKPGARQIRPGKLPRILDAAQLWIKNIVYNLPVPPVQSSSRPLLVLFAKAPVPGRVKTRLAAEWGEEAAAGLHSAFVLDTLEKLRQFNKFADAYWSREPTWRWAPAKTAVIMQSRAVASRLKCLRVSNGQPVMYWNKPSERRVPAGSPSNEANCGMTWIFRPT